jgi:hypothetical protein
MSGYLATGRLIQQEAYMARSPIYEPGFRPQFSGHETFPLRYGWLKKVIDAIDARAEDPNNKNVFLSDDAIAHFGVGKNMVSSMRYWALAARVIGDDSNGNYKGPFRVTPAGRTLFGKSGLDPYLEEPASLWWLHWQFAANAKPATTIYFVFNHFNASSFYRDQLLSELKQYCETQSILDIADFTLKRDVDCFVRTYAARVGESEDALESLMAELGLIQPVGRRDGFLLARGPKASLPDAMFWYALVEFAAARAPIRSFAVDTLAHDPGSPGRIFLLNEEALLERLNVLEELSGGALTWSESAGLRQIFFHEDPREVDTLKILAQAYRSRRRHVA